MKAKHLTLNDRKAIQEGIENRLSKTAIARSISKDPTTIAKEIKKHRILKPHNHCDKISHCRLDHYFYNASKAHEAYLFHLSEPEQILIAQTIGPLLHRGQSLYQILASHPEIDLSVKSLYTYIEGGYSKILA